MKKKRPAAELKPIPWWFWAGGVKGAVAAYFIAAVSVPGSAGYIVVWFTALVVLATREKTYRERVKPTPVRATVVGRPELSKPPVKGLPSGRRALSDRVG